MTIMLDLSPEVEKGLQTRADALGLSVSSFLKQMAEREAGSAAPRLSGEARAEAFLEWAESFPDTPVLSEAAMSRESFYTEMK